MTKSKRKRGSNSLNTVSSGIEIQLAKQRAAASSTTNVSSIESSRKAAAVEMELPGFIWNDAKQRYFPEGHYGIAEHAFGLEDEKQQQQVLQDVQKDRTTSRTFLLAMLRSRERGGAHVDMERVTERVVSARIVKSMATASTLSLRESANCFVQATEEPVEPLVAMEATQMRGCAEGYLGKLKLKQKKR